ncbi:MAG: hypothetical protein PHD67_07270 [Oscillospiraceae bacterium]|nr:hypothetical protein [Oscillospiraceae bacterium]
MKKFAAKALLLLLVFSAVFALGLIAFADSPDPAVYGFSSLALPAPITLDPADCDNSAAVNLADTPAEFTRYLYPLTGAANAPTIDGDLTVMASAVSGSPSVAEARLGESPNSFVVNAKNKGSAAITVTLHLWNDAQAKLDSPAMPSSTQTITYTVGVYDSVTVTANSGGDAAEKPLLASFGGKTRSFATLQALLDSDLIKAGNEVVVQDLSLTEDLTISKAVILRFVGTCNLTGNITATVAGVTVNNAVVSGSVLFQKENSSLLYTSAAAATFQGASSNLATSASITGALTFAQNSAVVSDCSAASFTVNNLTLTGLSSSFGWQDNTYSCATHSMAFSAAAVNASSPRTVLVNQSGISAGSQTLADRILTYNGVVSTNAQVFSTGQIDAFPSGTVLLLPKKDSLLTASPYLYLINESAAKLEKPSVAQASTTSGGLLSIPLAKGGSYLLIDQRLSNLTGTSPSSGSSSSSDDDDDTLLEASEVKSDLADSDSGDIVSFDVTSEYKVCYDVFELMKKKYSNRTIEFEGKGYAWRFKGSEISVPKSLIYLDTRVLQKSDYDKEIDRLAGDAEYEIVAFNYTGKFPGTATLLLDPSLRSSKYQLYRYNPDKNRLELVYSDLKENSSGYLKFSLTRSYDYVLTETAVKGAYTGSSLSASSSSSSASSSASSAKPSNPSTGIVTPYAPSQPSSSSQSVSSEPSSSVEEPSSAPEEPSLEPSVPDEPDEPVSVPGSADAPGPSPWLYIALGVAVLAALGLALAIGMAIARRKDN